MSSVVLVDAKRTPFGKFGGSLREITPVEMGGTVLRNLVGTNNVEPDEVDLVVMGICLPGSGLSPGRQSVLAAGLSVSTNALTVDRACCSAMTAVGLGFNYIRNETAKVVLAGGMENMSSTPYLVPQMRWGQRLGDFTVEDQLVIRNPYLRAPMATYAGEVALEYGVSRDDQDGWALLSQQRWAAAQDKGLFGREILPIETGSGKRRTLLERDEHARPQTTIEKLAALEPVYGSPTVTAGNASGICDGAAAILLMDENTARAKGHKPLARILGHVSICNEPRQSPAVPAMAIQKLLGLTGYGLDQIALIEINEAFASMPLVSSLILGDRDPQRVRAIRERVNVNGGAIAIGHPIGATGARLVATLAYELQRRGERYGIASICGAIGQADAVLIESVI